MVANRVLNMEIDEEDTEGIRRYGHSKDKRPDLPQVVIGLAVAKEGIPVRCWVLPKNTQDMTTVEAIKRDLKGWRLSRCIWVMDRGINSEENRIILQRAGGTMSKPKKTRPLVKGYWRGLKRLLKSIGGAKREVPQESSL